MVKNLLFFTKIRNKAKITLLLFFNILLEILINVVREDKEIKGIQIGKEELKLFADRHNTENLAIDKNLLEAIHDIARLEAIRLMFKRQSFYFYKCSLKLKTLCCLH